jgi:hypothetical protein
MVTVQAVVARASRLVLLQASEVTEIPLPIEIATDFDPFRVAVSVEL